MSILFLNLLIHEITCQQTNCTYNSKARQITCARCGHTSVSWHNLCEMWHRRASYWILIYSYNSKTRKIKSKILNKKWNKITSIYLYCDVLVCLMYLHIIVRALDQRAQNSVDVNLLAHCIQIKKVNNKIGTVTFYIRF